MAKNCKHLFKLIDQELVKFHILQFIIHSLLIMKLN